jgi:hypothetical protein
MSLRTVRDAAAGTVTKSTKCRADECTSTFAFSGNWIIGGKDFNNGEISGRSGSTREKRWRLPDMTSPTTN